MLPGTEDLGAWNKNRMQNADNFQMQVGGRWYTEKKDAGEALLQIRNELKLSMEDQKVGEYQGLTVGFHYVLSLSAILFLWGSLFELKWGVMPVEIFSVWIMQLVLSGNGQKAGR